MSYMEDGVVCIHYVILCGVKQYISHIRFVSQAIFVFISHRNISIIKEVRHHDIR